MAAERIIFEADFDTQVARDSAAKLLVDLEALRAQKRALQAQFKATGSSSTVLAEQINQLDREIVTTNSNYKAINKSLQLNDKIVNSNKNSYDALTAELNLAEKQLKELANTLVLNEDGSIELNEAFNKQFETVQKLKEAQLEFDSVIRNGRTNVGNYTESFKQAFNQLNLFGISGEQVTKGLGDLNEKGIKGSIKEFLNLKNVLIGLGIGVIILAFTALREAFSRSEKAQESFRKVTALLNQAFELLLVPFSSAVEILADLVDNTVRATAALSDFFGITDYASLNNAFALEEQLIAIEKQQAKQETRNADLLAAEEKLKTFRDDETKNIQDRIAANDKLAKTEQTRIQEIIKIENQKLAVLQKQLENATTSGRRAEINKQILEQQKVISDAIAESEGRQVEAITNKNSLLREQKQLQADIEALNLEIEIASGRIAAGSAAELNARVENIKTALALELEAVGENALAREQLEKQSQLEILKLQNDFRKSQSDAAKKFQDDSKKQREEAANQELALLRANEIILQNERRKRGADVQKIDTDILNAQTKIVEQEFAIKIAAIKKGSNEEKLLRLQLEQAKAELVIKQEDETIRKSIEQEQKLRSERQNLAIQAAQTEVLRLQNDLLEKQNLQQLDFELERELALKRFEAEQIELFTRLENNEITQSTFEQLRREALLNQESFEADLIQRKLALKAAEQQAQISIAQSLSESLQNIAEENTVVAKAALLLEKKAALAQVFLNLQEQLSNQATAASSLDALLPGSGIIYRVAAFASAIAQTTKIVSDIRKVGFADGGYTGAGGKYTPKGIVHAGEVVWSQEDVRAFGGVRAVEAIRPTSSIVPTTKTGQFFTGGIVGNRRAQTVETQQQQSNELISIIQNMPPPQVSVLEIQAVQNRVETIETITNIV